MHSLIRILLLRSCVPCCCKCWKFVPVLHPQLRDECGWTNGKVHCWGSCVATLRRCHDRGCCRMACILRCGQRGVYNLEPSSVGLCFWIRSVMEVPTDFKNSRLHDGGDQVQIDRCCSWRDCHGAEARSCMRQKKTCDASAYVWMYLCSLRSSGLCFSTSYASYCLHVALQHHI